MYLSIIEANNVGWNVILSIHSNSIKSPNCSFERLSISMEVRLYVLFGVKFKSPEKKNSLLYN